MDADGRRWTQMDADKQTLKSFPSAPTSLHRLGIASAVELNCSGLETRDSRFRNRPFKSSLKNGVTKSGEIQISFSQRNKIIQPGIDPLPAGLPQVRVPFYPTRNGVE